MTSSTDAPTGLPVFIAGQALQSLRDSGYSLSAAIGEVVDNAIEANANHIRIRMDESTNSRGKKHIHRLVFADDGFGMSEDVLHHYPVIGYSTRYMRTDTIGKFGVGAKLAALNFGRRLDVWSRTDANADWLHVHFDLDEALDAEKRGLSVEIQPPLVEPVPDDLAEMFPAGTGTVVVWSNVDRLEQGRRAENFDDLRVEVEKELSRIFRVMINDGIQIEINDTRLLAHDPLMLMRDTWAEKLLTEYYTDGEGAKAPWKPSPLTFQAETILVEEIKVAGHKAFVTVTLYPRAITRKVGLGRDNLAKKLRVPDNEGAISFMRLNREISYTNVPRIFPRGVQDPDRFIGIEVAFTPELDDYFGVRNVKRGAEPHDELRNKIRNLLKNAVATARDKLDEHWAIARRDSKQHIGEHGEVTDAAAEANRTMPKGRAAGEAEPERVFEDLANDVLGRDSAQQERDAYIERAKQKPFTVESVDFPGRQFIDVQHVNGQVIIRINMRHRFYREIWEPLKAIADSEPGTQYTAETIGTARRTVEALTLLLIAYGKAESMNEHPADQYGELRDYWGMFLDTLLGKVKNVL